MIAHETETAAEVTEMIAHETEIAAEVTERIALEIEMRKERNEVTNYQYFTRILANARAFIFWLYDNQRYKPYK